MKKKFRGFSLAELLISLLIISIVLSAAIPTVTRKMNSDREQIWHWDEAGKNNAYFGVGSNQTALLGAPKNPLDGLSLETILVDKEATDDNGTKFPNYQAVGDYDRHIIGDINLSGVKFSSVGDKLSVLKKPIHSESDFANSHISFFNMPLNGSALTMDDVEYAGRLTMDRGNLALGLGSLQSISNDTNGLNLENTAIGHFSLLRTTNGYRNTAVGKKALSFNEVGAYNTSLGFGSLYELGRAIRDDKVPEKKEHPDHFENTAIGALSQQNKMSGRFNTSLGAQSLKRNQVGDSNTAIGRLALQNNEKGDDNTALGAESCKYLKKGIGNICIGYGVANNASVQEDYYGLHIGTTALSYENDTVNEYGINKPLPEDTTPLISGHTQRVEAKNIEKELNVNARFFNINTFDTGENIFKVTTWSGSDGYGQNLSTTGYHGTFLFGLRKNGSETTSIEFIGQPNYALFKTYDEIGGKIRDLVFNDMLTFSYPGSPINPEKELRIYTAEDADTGVAYPILLNTTAKIGATSPHSLELTAENGFSVYNKDTEATLSLNKDSNLYVKTVGDTEISTYDDGSLNITTTSVKINANSGISVENGGISVETGDISVTTGDVKINSITGVSGNGVASNINKLYEEISSLRQQISQLSDVRKKDIQGDSTAGLKEINALEVKNFTYKDDKNKTPHVGVIAQQLQKIFPNSVFEGQDGYLRIRTEEIFYAMVNSIKELCAQIQDIVAKVSGLDKRITELENQNKMLLEQNKAFEKRLEKLEEKTSK